MDALNFLDIVEYRREIDAIAQSVEIADKTVFITGATGMIGSVVVDVLIEANRKFNLNNKIIASGRSMHKLQRRFNLQDDNLQLRVYNVDDRLDYSGQIDYIIHTASNADPQNYAKYPAETFLTNIFGTKNILDYCREQKGCRCLLMSTFEVYGNIEDKDVYSEEDVGLLDFNTLRSCYPESKRGMEVLAKCYRDEYGIDFVTARLCSIYGPTMAVSDNKAHAQFLKKALLGKDIVLKSKGDQVRSYCYVMDAVSAIFKILKEGITGEAYNVGNQNSVISIHDLALTIAASQNLHVRQEQPSKQEAKGYSKPQNIILSNRKLCALGWNGKFNISKGILSTIKILTQFQKMSKSNIEL